MKEECNNFSKKLALRLSSCMISFGLLLRISTSFDARQESIDVPCYQAQHALLKSAAAEFKGAHCGGGLNSCSPTQHGGKDQSVAAQPMFPPSPFVSSTSLMIVFPCRPSQTRPPSSLCLLFFFFLSAARPTVKVGRPAYSRTKSRTPETDNGSESLDERQRQRGT